MEEFLLLGVLLLFLWLALKVARMFIRVVLLLLIIGAAAGAYFVFLR